VAPGRGGQKSQDPRPISDKEYMKTSIHSVINYLTEHHYDRPIAPRVLSSPTTKDFVHILSFLLKAIDPNFKFGGKFEEEVPVIFKSLGYKITINKGPLQSVAAAAGGTFVARRAAQRARPAIARPVTHSAMHNTALSTHHDACACRAVLGRCQRIRARRWVRRQRRRQQGLSPAACPAQPCPVAPRRPCEALGRTLRTLHTTGLCRRQIFFDYLARAYQLFLGGEDDTSPLEEQVHARSRETTWASPRGTEVGCREGSAARETQSAPPPPSGRSWP
jgi:hypothetical protein